LPAKARDAERRCPTSGRAWSTFGPHAIGAERFLAVSSGTSFAQVAGPILQKQARGLNPDKDEVPGLSPRVALWQGRPGVAAPRRPGRRPAKLDASYENRLGRPFPSVGDAPATARRTQEHLTRWSTERKMLCNSW
jgi:hypothetical protein